MDEFEAKGFVDSLFVNPDESIAATFQQHQQHVSPYNNPLGHAGKEVCINLFFATFILNASVDLTQSRIKNQDPIEDVFFSRDIFLFFI